MILGASTWIATGAVIIAVAAIGDSYRLRREAQEQVGSGSV